MAEKTTVWEVRFRPSGPTEERKGSLSLEAGAIVFARADGSVSRRIAFADIRKAKRLRGSPVLLVVHTEEGGTARTAYYFAQPPSLDASRPELQQRPSVFGMRQDSRRRVRRNNVGYLGMWNRQKRELLESWVQAVRAGMGNGGA